ncbi:MAG: AAA family ATPase [Hyphomicrobiales bacterium]|nr:AAA family ATPase [Hyphomicrobiales bacterium]
MARSQSPARASGQASEAAEKLPPERLVRRCDLSGLEFKTTADLDEGDGLLGQERAIEAIRFSTAIDRHGFNLFVIGPPGAGKRTVVRKFLEDKARRDEPPLDWVYVNNFAEPHKPRAISLPPGRALAFRDSMAELIDELGTLLPAAFESEDYQNRRNAIEEQFRHKQEEAFEALRKEAETNQVAILRTPMGFAMAPATPDGQVMKPDVFNELPEDRRKAFETVIEGLQEKLAAILKSIPKWDKERRLGVRELNRDAAKSAVGQSIEEVQTNFKDLPQVIEHLEVVRQDLIDNAGLFIASSGEEESGIVAIAGMDGRFDRYQVNVIVGQEPETSGAPVVEETHPSLRNLLGRVEHMSQQGALTTNFSLIKGGALHRANGGYLLIDVRQLLIEPLSWVALKRALKTNCITIESMGEYLSLISTISLEPDPIPLGVKLVLFGDRLLYYLLAEFDPDVRELFKVVADFDDSMPWAPETAGLYARLIAGVCRRDGLCPFDRDAVARVVERCGRFAEDSKRLSLLVDPMADLMREADFRAREAKRDVVTATDVDAAVEAQIRRSSRLKERAEEHILRGIALVDTEGQAVGQVNGLSVLQLGGFAFGRPSRITARVRLGAGKVVDIEREVELGGPIHSKGVLILSGYLAAQYAPEAPMSLAATLVFEQSYGGVEGDSASAAELFALISALAEVPLRQDLAVTGSINQMGHVQAIGGVNEKIEGHFDLCKARGLTGTQGVIIPDSNVQHLMLRDDVIEACAAGKFAVYSIATVDQGLALLTGMPAGVRRADGAFPDGSVNRRAEERLVAFAEARKRFGAAGEAAETEKKP